MECATSDAVKGGGRSDLAEDPTHFEESFHEKFAKKSGAEVPEGSTARVEPEGADPSNLDEAVARRMSFSDGTAADLETEEVGPRRHFFQRQGYLFANGFDTGWEEVEALRQIYDKKSMTNRSLGGPKNFKDAGEMFHPKIARSPPPFFFVAHTAE